MPSTRKLRQPFVAEPVSLHSVTNHELLKAQSMIEQFIYSCSHSMRAPLKSISGLIYILKNTTHVHELDSHYYLITIEKTILKMELLLSELEQFLLNSKKDLITQEVKIKAVLTDLTTEFSDDLQKQGIAVNLKINQSVPFYSDQKRFGVILSHLLANAIAFCDDRKSRKKISVSATVTSSSCELTIRDNGIGIPPEVLPNIFDLFYRGTERSVGAGVGLFIVREIVNKLGGSIEVKSNADKGTAFIVSIPNLSK